MPTFNEELTVNEAAPADANSAQLKIADDDGKFVLLGRAADYGFLQSHNRSPLALNPLGNKVGVGTAQPKRSLHITGPAPADANDGQLQISEPNGNFLLLGRAASHAFVQSHNNEPLALNPLGNKVGVGTAQPKRSLHITGPAPADANDGQLQISEPGGNFLLLGRAAAYAFVQSHNNDSLILNPLGNRVGIGTTTPEAALDVNGSIRVADDVILRGADCAEEFDVDPTTCAEPGTVMVIGPEQQLKPCSRPYDKRVAGIISGAGDCRPGIVLGRLPAAAGHARMAVALNGTVFCKVDCTTSPIEVGDLLTTSARPGHAMRAEDAARSFGTVVGKALEGLADGLGMIRVLVALQ